MRAVWQTHELILGGEVVGGATGGWGCGSVRWWHGKLGKKSQKFKCFFLGIFFYLSGFGCRGEGSRVEYVCHACMWRD